MISTLKIGSGQVVFNDLPEVINLNSAEVYEVLKEDLIQIVYSDQFLIDVGWYPSFHENGKFTLILIQNGEWEKPIFKKRTRSIQEVKATIEEYAAYIESNLK